jgi:heme/copper-type cytochrome/quinol oxidase subunit 2
LLGYTNWGVPSAIAFRSEDLHWFHDYVLCFLFGVILILVLGFLFLMAVGYGKFFSLSPSKIELLMSVYPTIVLLLQIVPSLYLVYSGTSLETTTELTIKIVGHQ